MKTVCILSSVHPALDTRVFYKEAKSLVKAGYSVTLIAQHDKNEIIDGVKIIALPKPNGRIHRMFGLTSKIFYLALKQKAEIYHFHDPELLMLGILLKKLFAKKVICDVHEDYPKDVLSKKYIPESLRKFAAHSMDFIQKLFFRHFDCVVVAGKDIADNLVKTSVDNNRIIVLRNVPPKEFVRACSNESEVTSNRIVYAGGLHRDRGIKELVEAMGYIKNDATLFLVGSFDDYQFEKEIRGMCYGKVNLVDQVPFKRLPDFLKTMRIGLICFHPEPNNLGALSGRNNKIYEYMAAGLAIVASDFPVFKNFIEEENVGITVNAEDPKAIAAGIDFLLDHPSIVTTMRENGIKAVHNKYNWEIEKDKLLGIYQTI